MVASSVGFLTRARDFTAHGAVCTDTVRESALEFADSAGGFLFYIF